MIAITQHAYVTGRVQGVWYRASTRKKAKQLGLCGWVKNLEDGRVELVATGDSHAVKSLMAWCWKGSPLAKVKAVEVSDMVLTQFDEFK